MFLDSISAGLDYPGVGPEHSYLKDTGRAMYVAVSDEEVLEGFQLLCPVPRGLPPPLNRLMLYSMWLR